MQRVFLRFVGYGVAVALVMGIMLLVTVNVPGSMRLDEFVGDSALRTSEFSPVEMLQNVLLLICTAIFHWIAQRDRLRRPMAFALSTLLLACLIRELDFFLDYYVIDNLWQVLFAVVAALGVVNGVRGREIFVQGWRRSWPSAGLAMILGGFILLIGFAQPAGNDAFWHAIMGDGYLRIVKIAVEEFSELGAYLLITVGSVEFLFAWSRLPRKRKRKN